MNHRSLVLISILLLSACSSFPKARNLGDETKSFDRKPIARGYGVAFGDLESGGEWGTAMLFENTSSHEIQGITGAKRFAVELPPGRYRVSGFGGRARNRKPKDPSPGLEFAVSEGKATYLGTLVLDYIDEHAKCDAALISGPARVKPTAYYAYVGYNKGFMDLGSVTEVDYDRSCLAQYDNLKADYSASGMAAKGVGPRDLIPLQKR